MRRLRAVATLVRMGSPHPSIRVDLVLDLGREPIAGRLLGQGHERCFVGWLDLASALQRLLEQSHESAPRPGARSREGAA